MTINVGFLATLSPIIFIIFNSTNISVKNLNKLENYTIKPVYIINGRKKTGFNIYKHTYTTPINHGNVLVKLKMLRSKKLEF